MKRAEAAEFLVNLPFFWKPFFYMTLTILNREAVVASQSAIPFNKNGLLECVIYLQVRSWMMEVNPGVASRIISYIIGVDSLRANADTVVKREGNGDIRLRMDGLFEQESHAVQFTKEFIALYTNGPAGGGGIRLVLQPFYF